MLDDHVLCHVAFDRGCLRNLSSLLESITPIELNADEEDEPENICALREVRTLGFPSPTDKLKS